MSDIININVSNSNVGAIAAGNRANATGTVGTPPPRKQDNDVVGGCLAFLLLGALVIAGVLWCRNPSKTPNRDDALAAFEPPAIPFGWVYGLVFNIW